MSRSATNMSEKNLKWCVFRNISVPVPETSLPLTLLLIKYWDLVTRDLVPVNLIVNNVFLKDYSCLVKHGKMLRSTCRNILGDFGSIFLNDVRVLAKNFMEEQIIQGRKKNFVQEYYSSIGSSRGIHGNYKPILKCEIITWVSWSRCVVVCWSHSIQWNLHQK